MVLTSVFCCMERVNIEAEVSSFLDVVTRVFHQVRAVVEVTCVDVERDVILSAVAICEVAVALHVDEHVVTRVQRLDGSCKHSHT